MFTNRLRHFSLKILLHSSNFPMVARIEMKLGTYAYYIISMTITCFHDNHILFEKPQAIFKKLLLLKPANCSSHGSELGAHVYYIVSKLF